MKENDLVTLKIAVEYLFDEGNLKKRKRGAEDAIRLIGLEDLKSVRATIHDQAEHLRMISVDRIHLENLANEDWFLFMNHGYHFRSASDTDIPELTPRDLSWRHQAYMYHFLFSLARPNLCRSINDSVLLDVGCGRGGGLSLLERQFRPRLGIGLDYNPNQVTFCRRKHKSPNLSFLAASSMQLPFEDASIDIATNVESSHSYPDVAGFLREVHRVLKPGGVLVLADNRPTRSGSDALLSLEILSSDFNLMHHENITAAVQRACQIDATELRAPYLDEQSRIVRGIAANSERGYSSGDACYWAFALQKP